MTTPNELLADALTLCGQLGTGQTPHEEDFSRAFRFFNRMIATWNRQRWIIYGLRDMACQLTGSDQYSVGPGGDFHLGDRPNKIEGAYLRQFANSVQPIDFKLTILRSREEYAEIAIKNISSIPSCVYYDNEYPQGNLFVWPGASLPFRFELHILVKDEIGQFSSPFQPIILPPEYEQAIIYNLAMMLRPVYGLDADPQITGIAKSSLSIIRNANAQLKRLEMPSELGGPIYQGGVYNNGGFIESNAVVPIGGPSYTGQLASGLSVYQFAASTQWIINHGDRPGNPLVTLADPSGNAIDADVTYASSTQIIVTFLRAEAGTATLNY